MHKLETDDNGNIITNPVTGWATHTAAGSALILAVQYVSTPDQLERGESNSIQLVLTPQQCLELVETLKTGANVLLTPVAGTTLQ